MAIQMRDYKRERVDCSKGGRTKQSFKHDADPNRLMKQFTKTGDLDLLKQSKAIAMYGDFSQVPDFFTACLQVQECEEAFLELPSAIRNRMENSPSKFLDFLSDEANLSEAIELGLVEAPIEEADPKPSPTVAKTPQSVPDGSVQGGE